MSSRFAAMVIVLSSLVGAARADTTPSANPVVADAAARMRAGELVLARDRLAFAPCDDRAGRAIDATRARELATLVRDRNDGGDGALFVVGMVARGDDGAWRIDRVENAYRDGPRCTDALDAFIWRAQGEGGWSLQATSRWITIRLPDEAPMRFRFAPFAADGEGRYRYHGHGPDGVVAIVVTRGRCTRDDALFSYSIDLTTRGREYRGCAWNGTPATPRDGAAP